MKKINKIAITIINVVFFCKATIDYLPQPEPAFCCVPVADLVDEPLITEHENNQYEHLSLTIENGCPCHRMHQLLFNERVHIIAQTDNEYFIEIDSLENNVRGSLPSVHNHFWTHTTSLIPFNQLEKNNLATTLIPTAPSTSFTKQEAITIALLDPVYHHETDTTFSAGTRFIVHQETAHTYTISVYNKMTNQFNNLTIDKKICIKNKLKNNEECIQQFVTLLKHWAHPPAGFIPYVWGGCSYIDCCHDNDHVHNSTLSYGECFERNDCTITPRSGFDCSGLIWRAAQMSAMPYYLLASDAIIADLQPLQKNELLRAGDIIWYPGHVMVVADTHNNTIIEARGYVAGYGKVHEIELKDLFKNVTTYDELVTAYHQQEPLTILHPAGYIHSAINEFKLLKIHTIFTR